MLVDALVAWTTFSNYRNINDIKINYIKKTASLNSLINLFIYLHKKYIKSWKVIHILNLVTF